MKTSKKVIIAVLIIIIVSLISYFCNEKLILLLYSTILSLFPNEIKSLFNGTIFSKQIRISYSYIFRVEIDGSYLLVKDEQGRNHFHPVGGVYKYDPDKIDIVERFGGVYDRVFNSTPDTENDLRLIISKKKFKDFNMWFKSNTYRENFKDLSREFKEELIDKSILPQNEFKSIRYKYIGSHIQKSYNSNLKMIQIRHFDILDLKLTTTQKNCLKQLLSITSSNYVFASPRNIKDGNIDFGAKSYNIPEYTKLILTGSDKRLTKESDVNIEYITKIKSSQTP